MECENNLCGRVNVNRLILIKKLGLRFCEPCYFHYRNHNGEIRKQRLCRSCSTRIPSNAVKEYCSKCWIEMDCVFDGCLNRRIKWNASGLCSGHTSMLNRDGKLRPLWGGMISRDGLDNCPIHDFPHRKTDKGHNRCSICDRESRWRRDYGLEPKEVYKLFKSQDGVCALHSCSREIDLFDRHSYGIDHCHDTGLVRGILCPLHNQMLGMAEDKISILKDAIEYLKGNNV